MSTEPIKVVHVQPSKDPYKAFGAPVLEWCIFYLNESNSGSKEKKAELQGLVEVLVGAVTGGEGVVDALWGSVVERPNTVAMLIGWTSVEVSPVQRIRRPLLIRVLRTGSFRSGDGHS